MRKTTSGLVQLRVPEQADFVEHFPYQDGLLISLWDTSQSNNNTSQHPGEGLVLPIDAHPRTIYNLDGQPWRPRIQMYDATFGLQKVDSFTLHNPATGNASYLRGQNGNPLFDDSNPNRYFKTDQPTGGVTVSMKPMDTNDGTLICAAQLTVSK